MCSDVPGHQVDILRSGTVLHGVSEHVTIATTVRPGSGVGAESNLGKQPHSCCMTSLYEL